MLVKATLVEALQLRTGMLCRVGEEKQARGRLAIRLGVFARNMMPLDRAITISNDCGKFDGS